MRETLSSPLSFADLERELVRLTRQIERTDEIEDPIERTAKREWLLVQYDDLQVEIEAGHANERASF